MNHSEEDAHSRVEMIHQDVASDFDAYPEEGFAVTDEIDGKSFWMRSRNRLFSRQLQDLTSNRPDSKFLEVGCGNGSFLRYVSDKTSADITGSEVYVPGVLATQAKVSGIRLMQLDATRMPFSDVYDVVAAFDVLEHIDEDEKAIAGIHKALKPGGAFMVSVPQYQWMWSDLDEIVKHRRRYGRSELVEKLQTAGFDVSYVTSHVFILFPLMAASRLLTNILKKKAESTREHTQFSDISNAICDALMRIDEFLIARNSAFHLAELFMRLLEKNTHRQILGYLFVSGLNFGLTFSVFTVSLKLLGIAYPIALLLAFVMGNMFTYVLNYLFVFKAGEKFAYSPFLKYIFANSFTFGVNLVGLIFIVETFNTDPFWTQVVLILPIILVNFLTAKLWSLRQAAS